ncbi:MAG: hypothetical protein ACI8Y4_002665 [Candidatus Poriferisodalaceae bacterium]|jgi:hypothetical protein
MKHGTKADYEMSAPLFAPENDSLPVEAFLPMLDEVFSRPSQVPGIAPLSD